MATAPCRAPAADRTLLQPSGPDSGPKRFDRRISTSDSSDKEGNEHPTSKIQRRSKFQVPTATKDLDLGSSLDLGCGMLARFALSVKSTIWPTLGKIPVDVPGFTRFGGHLFFSSAPT